MGDLFAGVDIGSTTSKAALMNETGRILSFALLDTTFNRNQSGEDALTRALATAALDFDDLDMVVSTGYGRRSFKRAQKALPEIICHARGTMHLYPGTRTIIDIGGQDSKVIELGPMGQVEKFEMNDKCAAGTGRFFEVLTNRLLNISLEELGPLALKSKKHTVISSMCTIFAESEIISYLSEGVPSEDIAMGMLFSVAKRIISMGKQARIPFDEPIVFSGGVAKNIAAAGVLEELLGKRVVAIENPQQTAAVGAALCARDEFKAAFKNQVELAGHNY